MTREWFTIPELRAAKVPTFGEDFFTQLIFEYPELPSTVARARPYLGSSVPQLEFHLSMFLLVERVALQRYWAQRPIEERIIRLGIHRRVDTSRDGVMKAG